MGVRPVQKTGLPLSSGVNGADLLHGAGESRTEDGPSWGAQGAAGVQCMHAAAAAAAVQAEPALRVACCPPLGSVLKDYVAINGRAGHQCRGRSPAAQCMCGGGAAARGGARTPGPAPAAGCGSGAALTCGPSALGRHSMPRPAAGRWGNRQTVPDGTRRGSTKRGMVAGRAEGRGRVPERSTPLRHGVFPGRAAPTRPGSAIGASGTVHRRAQPAPRAAPQRSPSPPRAQAPPAAPPRRMAAPQVAGARAVLGLGVRAAQAPELKHQAAKQFFKEVRSLLGNRGGSIAGPWTRARRPGASAKPPLTVARPPPLRAALRRLPLPQPSRCNTAARSRPACAGVPLPALGGGQLPAGRADHGAGAAAQPGRHVPQVHRRAGGCSCPRYMHSEAEAVPFRFRRVHPVLPGSCGCRRGHSHCPSQPQSSAGCRTHQHDAAFLCATQLVQSPEVVDLLIYKGREELEVCARRCQLAVAAAAASGGVRTAPPLPHHSILKAPACLRLLLLCCLRLHAAPPRPFRAVHPGRATCQCVGLQLAEQTPAVAPLSPLRR